MPLNPRVSQIVHFILITRAERPITHGHVRLHVFAEITNPGERTFRNVASVRAKDNEVWTLTFNELVFREYDVKNLADPTLKTEPVGELNSDLLLHNPVATFSAAGAARDRRLLNHTFSSGGERALLKGSPVIVRGSYSFSSKNSRNSSGL